MQKGSWTGDMEDFRRVRHALLFVLTCTDRNDLNSFRFYWYQHLTRKENVGWSPPGDLIHEYEAGMESPSHHLTYQIYLVCPLPFIHIHPFAGRVRAQGP